MGGGWEEAIAVEASADIQVFSGEVWGVVGKALGMEVEALGMEVETGEEMVEVEVAEEAEEAEEAVVVEARKAQQWGVRPLL